MESMIRECGRVQKRLRGEFSGQRLAREIDPANGASAPLLSQGFSGPGAGCAGEYAWHEPTSNPRAALQQARVRPWLTNIPQPHAAARTPAHPVWITTEVTLVSALRGHSSTRRIPSLARLSLREPAQRSRARLCSCPRGDFFSLVSHRRWWTGPDSGQGISRGRRWPALRGIARRSRGVHARLWPNGALVRAVYCAQTGHASFKGGAAFRDRGSIWVGQVRAFATPGPRAC